MKQTSEEVHCSRRYRRHHHSGIFVEQWAAMLQSGASNGDQSGLSFSHYSDCGAVSMICTGTSTGDIVVMPDGSFAKQEDLMNRFRAAGRLVAMARAFDNLATTAVGERAKDGHFTRLRRCGPVQ